MKCDICNNREAVYKGKNIITTELVMICEYCDPPNIELLGEIKKDDSPKEKVASEYGRLHFVKSPRKDAICRVCSKEIKVKESSFTQAVHGEGFFPAPKKVCMSCGNRLIKEGMEAVGYEIKKS